MNSRKLPIFSFWRGVLLLIFLAGIYSTVLRFAGGLGHSTALSDEFPWGLWIGFDVLCGVALAAGGFTLSAVVYIFNIERFKPIIRPTILTAFLGYLLVIIGLLFDLGQPQRIWHPLFMWNPHSVMFEVAWCVMFYTTVLFLEFTPMLFERLRLGTALKIIHAVTIPLVIVGVILSGLHQSSLGSLYLIVPAKLHALWYSPLLPIFFFISAIALGCAMTIFESFLSFRAFGKRLELNLLAELGKVIVVVLSVYLVLKLQDLAGRHVLDLILRPSYESRMFLAEALLGVLGPILLLLIPKVRNSHVGLFVASVMVVLGFIMNRLNISITGMEAAAGRSYFPSWTELSVTFMIVAAGFLLFGMAVKFLPVFPSGTHVSEPAPEHSRQLIPHLIPEPLLAGSRGVLVMGVAFLLSAVLLGYSGLKYREVSIQGVAEVSRKVDIMNALSYYQMAPDIVFAQAESSPGKVVLRHSTHVDSASPDCTVCHSKPFKILKRDEAAKAIMAGGDMHDEQRCGSCHNGQKAFSVRDDCTLCHSSE
jgi:c(7)-type cytochrome triheme protein